MAKLIIRQFPDREVPQAAVANAANWLRLVFHALTCGEAACPLAERCTSAKQLLSTIVECGELQSCPQYCQVIRRLLLHWSACQDGGCALCGPVWRDLSGGQGSEGDREGAAAESRNGDRTSSRQRGQLYLCGDSDPTHGQARQQGNEGVGRAEEGAAAGPDQEEAEESPDASLATSACTSQATSAAASCLPSGSVEGEGPTAPQGGELPPPPTPGGPADATAHEEAGAAARAQVHGLKSQSLGYLAQSLLCREAQDPRALAAGRELWRELLAAPPPPPRQAPLPPPAAPAAAAPAPQPSPAAAPPPSVAAARRLLVHTLGCVDARCACCEPVRRVYTRRQRSAAAASAGGGGGGGGAPRDGAAVRAEQLSKALAEAFGGIAL